MRAAGVPVASRAGMVGSIALAVAALTFAVPAASVASTQAESEFVARANETCRQYFGAVATLDTQVKRHLVPATTPRAQIVLTADLLGFNGRLSLDAEARLARLRAPDGGERMWRSALGADRTSGTLTLALAVQLTQLTTLASVNGAISAYDATYQRAEATFTRDVRQLHVTGCA